MDAKTKARNFKEQLLLQPVVVVRRDFDTLFKLFKYLETEHAILLAIALAREAVATQPAPSRSRNCRLWLQSGPPLMAALTARMHDDMDTVAAAIPAVDAIVNKFVRHNLREAAQAAKAVYGAIKSDGTTRATKVVARSALRSLQPNRRRKQYRQWWLLIAAWPDIRTLL